MSLKHEIDKIKGVGTDHAKLARDYYLNIVKKDVEHIKEEILKQAKEGQDGYTGVLNLEFNQGKDTSYNIQYTLPGNYEGYKITKKDDKFSLLTLENKVFKEIVKQINPEGGYTFKIALTTIGGPYLDDITTKCREEGIILNCYLYGTGRIFTKDGSHLKIYDKVQFNRTYKSACSSIRWELRAEYKVI